MLILSRVQLAGSPTPWKLGMASMPTFLTSEVTGALFTSHSTCVWPVTIDCHTCDHNFLDCKDCQGNMMNQHVSPGRFKTG